MRLLLFVACLGCGSATPAASSSPRSEAPSAPTASAPVSPAAAPEPGAPMLARGLYHREGALDAENLDLDVAAGTFRWGIDGCDFGGAATGTIRHEGGVLVLTGNVGVWPGLTVRVRPTQTGFELVRDIGGEPDVQVWAPGGVCAVCGGSLGPSAGPIPCDAPSVGG